MILDGTTIAAIFGFLGLVVTTIGGVYVATRTNKTEKQDSAQKALEQTRDEAYEARILLRDEQLAALRVALEQCEAQSAAKSVEIEKLKGHIP